MTHSKSLMRDLCIDTVFPSFSFSFVVSVYLQHVGIKVLKRFLVFGRTIKAEKLFFALTYFSCKCSWLRFAKSDGTRVIWYKCCTCKRTATKPLWWNPGMMLFTRRVFDSNTFDLTFWLSALPLSMSSNTECNTEPSCNVSVSKTWHWSSQKTIRTANLISPASVTSWASKPSTWRAFRRRLLDSVRIWSIFRRKEVISSFNLRIRRSLSTMELLMWFTRGYSFDDRIRFHQNLPKIRQTYLILNRTTSICELERA